MTALALQDQISQRSRHEKRYATLAVQYGDGYMQRASDGINPEQEMWNVRYDNLDRTQYQTMLAFFDTVKMSGVIEWAPTIEGSPAIELKWVVDHESDIKINNKTGDFYDITFTLKRVYDL